LVGTDPSRSIRGLLCRLVRRLRADGQTAEVIGRALNLEVTAVEAYLFPPSPPPKLPGTTNGGGRAD
jgi:hypothetical protein